MKIDKLIKKCELAEENSQNLLDYLTTQNEDFLKSLKKEKPPQLTNTRVDSMVDIVNEHGVYGYKAFCKIYGSFATYGVLAEMDREVAKTFFSEDEINFLSIFKLSYMIRKAINVVPEFDNLCSTSTEFLLQFYNKKLEYNVKSYIYLALLCKDVDLSKYDVAADFENYIKSLLNRKTLDLIDDFDPTKTMDNKLCNEFNEDGYGVYNSWKLLFFIAMNKSVFLDKICVTFFSFTVFDNSKKIILSEYLNSKYIKTSKEIIYQFMLKYRPNFVCIATNIGEEIYDIIKEKNELDKEDYFSVVRFKSIDFNRDFLFEKTNDVDLEFMGSISSINALSLNSGSTNSYINRVLSLYKSNFSEDEFYNRLDLLCIAYSPWASKDEIKRLESFSHYKLGLNMLVNILNVMNYEYPLNSSFSYDISAPGNKENVQIAAKFLSQNDEFISFAINNYKDFEVNARFIIINILALDLVKYQSDFVKLNETSKKVKTLVSSIYREKSDLALCLLDLLKSKKLADRKKAFTYLSSAYGTGYINEICSAFEIEENAKLKNEMDIFLSENDIIKSENSTAEIEQVDEFVQTIQVLLKHENIIKKIPIETFSKVKNTTGEDVDVNLVKASLLSFAKDNITNYSSLCEAIVSDFDCNSHAEFARDLFNHFIEGKAETKNGWVLFYCSIYGGDAVVDLLVSAVNLFVSRSRGEFAGVVVKALSLNSSNRALVVIEEMSRKFKHKTVKKVALSSMDTMARRLNISPEQLADRVVPNFGFDDEFKRVFDYGNRQFNVYLTVNLSFKIVDETGKVIKNLPKVGAKDDAETAQASIDEFKAMKKELAATIKTQSERLELAMLTGRNWSYDEYFNVFVKNPIMNRFATCLVWGVYSNNELIETFRYMEDGSFNSVDEEDVTFKEGIKGINICLVHPIELSEELLSKWKKQLADYEIIQPILQLNRSCFYAQNSDLSKLEIAFDEDECYNKNSLKTKLLEAGWETGAVEDGGYFYTFINHYLYADVVAKLEFSGMNIVYDFKDDLECNLVKLSFANRKNEQLKISEVPTKIISEFYLVLSTVIKWLG